jgi:hypothetical protein
VSIAVAGAMGSRERNIFNIVKGKFKDGIPSPSYLRIEQGISNSKNLYSFDVKKNGNEQIQELKLDRNDVFVVHSLAVFISAQDNNAVGKEALQTYPNKNAFGVAGGFNYKELEAIYNGFLRLKETIGKDLPKGFQTAEFVLEHGFLDKIIPRTELKEKLGTLLGMLKN